MTKTALDITPLEHELKELREDDLGRGRRRDELFVAWFLRAYAAESFEDAFESLTGASRDKGLDAIYIDDDRENILIVQGKARKSLMTSTERAAEVKDFARLTEMLVAEEDDEKFVRFFDGLNPEASARFEAARERLKRGYRAQLVFVTAGRVSDDTRSSARFEIASGFDASCLEIIDGRQLIRLVHDYQDGVAPPVPSLELSVEPLGQIEHGERPDPHTWVVAMNGKDVGDLYRMARKRLFARNIRGYLGDTKINASMLETLRLKPEAFFYYNNGVTIVCDGLLPTGGQRNQRLLVSNPQIINGQQTTRTLNLAGKRAADAQVLVRVIQVDRDTHDGSRSDYDDLVSNIVKATNWQNSITPADLRSNAPEQVEIEREFRKLGYQYLRKRETRRDAATRVGGHLNFKLKKEELARAVGTCKQDQFVYKVGSQKRFEDPWYEKIFADHRPEYYLSCYWLTELAKDLTRGDPVANPAKWLAIHLAWREVGDRLRRDLRFARACELGDDDPLVEAVKNLLTVILEHIEAYYRKHREVDGVQLEPATFFRSHIKRQDLEGWRSAAKQRAVKKAVGDVRSALLQT